MSTYEPGHLPTDETLFHEYWEMEEDERDFVEIKEDGDWCTWCGQDTSAERTCEDAECPRYRRCADV